MNDKLYRGFVVTSRDHVHGLKGMKYWYGEIKEWMDAYAEHQPEDGMVWNFFKNRDKKMTHFEMRFPEKFWKVLENGEEISFKTKKIENSKYIVFNIAGIQSNIIKINY